MKGAEKQSSSETDRKVRFTDDKIDSPSKSGIKHSKPPTKNQTLRKVNSEKGERKTSPKQKSSKFSLIRTKTALNETKNKKKEELKENPESLSETAKAPMMSPNVEEYFPPSEEEEKEIYEEKKDSPDNMIQTIMRKMVDVSWHAWWCSHG